jgi:hypothetical protein
VAICPQTLGLACSAAPNPRTVSPAATWCTRPPAGSPSAWLPRRRGSWPAIRARAGTPGGVGSHRRAPGR